MTNLLTLQGIECAAVLGRARERVISDELHTMLVTWLESPVQDSAWFNNWNIT